MNILFFDINIDGHHSEYINHLVDYLVQNDINNHCFYFVVNTDFSRQFPEILSKTTSFDTIFWIEITLKELNKAKSGNIIFRSFSEYSIMNHYAKKYKIDHVFLLYFNTVQLALAFFRPSYQLSGILFLQFYRMSKVTLKEKIKYFRKYMLTKLYSLNWKLKTVFILNDQKTVSYLNQELDTTIFKMLPDPIPNLIPLAGFNIYDHYSIDKERKIFLHIGALSNRKGTLEIIDSALYFSEKSKNEIAILLVGKANNEDMQREIEQHIKSINTGSNIVLIWDNQFVPSSLMKSLFDQCYAVLMPYKNAEASSGILGHAIASNKIVIATGQGLLRDLIEENNLGILIDEIAPCEIAKAIEESLFSINNSKYSSILIEECSPINFSAQIMMSLKCDVQTKE